MQPQLGAVLQKNKLGSWISSSQEESETWISLGTPLGCFSQLQALPQAQAGSPESLGLSSTTAELPPGAQALCPPPCHCPRLHTPSPGCAWWPPHWPCWPHCSEGKAGGPTSEPTEGRSLTGFFQGCQHHTSAWERRCQITREHRQMPPPPLELVSCFLPHPALPPTICKPACAPPLH